MGKSINYTIFGSPVFRGAVSKTIATILSLCFLCQPALAVDVGGFVKAQLVLGQLNQVMGKYKEVQAMLASGEIELEYKEPLTGADGKFVLPFDDAGNLTPWAEKALTAQAGAAVGGMVGDKVVGAALAKVPFGGLFAGKAKSMTKGSGAILAIGGWDYIRETSTQSFNSLADYSVYLHMEFDGLPGYEEALAAAMVIYPKLEKSHKKYIDKAYKKARKDAKRAAKKLARSQD